MRFQAPALCVAGLCIATIEGAASLQGLSYRATLLEEQRNAGTKPLHRFASIRDVTPAPAPFTERRSPGKAMDAGGHHKKTAGGAGPATDAAPDWTANGVDDTAANGVGDWRPR